MLCGHAIVWPPNGLGNDCRYARSRIPIQLIDSSHKSLAEFTFASIERESFASRRKHISTVFATICWFNELRLCLGAETSVVQRILDAIDENYEDPQTARRRWQDYRAGIHSPAAQVIALAERRCPGTSHILQSPLWDSLRLDRSASRVGLTLMGRTCTEGDELLSRMLGSIGRLPSDRRWLNRRCTAIILTGNLEGLGVLTVCMRLAGEAKLDSAALIFCRAATRCLLVLGVWFYEHGVAQAIAEYYEYVLLPRCYSDPAVGVLYSCASYYLNTIEALDRLRVKAETEKGRPLDPRELAAVILRVLDT